MMFRIVTLLIFCAITLQGVQVSAQFDALNLPADLYVLLNDGIVQRYGRGAAGVEAVTPPDEFVIDFAVSQDGRQISYRTEAGLIIADLDAPETARQVDTMAGYPPLRGRGFTMAWSPQGDAIAYTTADGVRVYYTIIGAFATITQPNLQGLSWSPDGMYLVGEAGSNIWWIYRRDGSQFALQAAIPSSYGLEWVTNRVPVFAPHDGGLLTMNLAAANAQAALLDNAAVYRYPTLAPDGRLYFFRRLASEEETPEGYGTLVALSPGTPQVEVLGQTPIDLGGNLRWGPGAGVMVAFEGGVLALFDPRTGQGFPLPVTNAVAYAWGPYPPPDSAAPPDVTAEAIFPETFPTLDPATQIPGIGPATEETLDAQQTQT